MTGVKLHYAIIGCGSWAHTKHISTLKKISDEVKITSFCDIRKENAEKAAKFYGSTDSKIFSDYRQVLEDKSIDSVIITTPNITHSNITIDALESGKHVLCEKPMAINTIEAKKMLETQKRTNKKLYIAYQNRFREDVQFLYNACKDGKLGEIYFAKAHAIRRRGVPSWGVFLDKEKQGGGPLIDIGSHALDMTLWMMDNYEVKNVRGSVYQKLKNKNLANKPIPFNPEDYHVEDSAFAFITMKNNATIFLESAWSLNTTDEREGMCTLCGTEAGATMNGSYLMGDSKLFINGEIFGELYETEMNGINSYPMYKGIKDNEFEAEAKHWIDVIVNDKDQVVKPTQAYKVTQIIEAIYDSGETGTLIEF